MTLHQTSKPHLSNIKIRYFGCFRQVELNSITLFNGTNRLTNKYGLDRGARELRGGGGGGGRRLPNKGRYGCAASAKPRPGKISQKNLMPGQKVPQNRMTGQVFMTFKLCQN